MIIKKLIKKIKPLFCAEHSYDKIIYELETESENYYSKETLKECKCGQRKLFSVKRYY